MDVLLLSALNFVFSLAKVYVFPAAVPEFLSEEATEYLV
jgi:hypothetical protein